jgi:acetyl-CoA acetyltransferase
LSLTGEPAWRWLRRRRTWLQVRNPREEQDAFARNQQLRRAYDACRLQEDRPDQLKSRKGSISSARRPHRPETTMEILAKLPTAFSKDGFVTAGNASGMWTAPPP